MTRARPAAAAWRRPPAGYHVASESYRHVVMAGSVLVCLACGAEGHTTASARVDLARYNADVEAFIARHAPCAYRSDPPETRS